MRYAIMIYIPSVYFFSLLYPEVTGLPQGSGTAWTQIQNLFWKTWDRNMTYSHMAETVHLVASLTLDFNSPLAKQAKRLAVSELSGSREEYADAMFVSLYGEPEEEEKRRIKREANYEFQEDEGILQHIWEMVQFEYFLYYYRHQEQIGKRKKRMAPTFAGLLSSINQIDVELASNIKIGDVEDGEEEDSVEEPYEEPRYNAYIADVAYFFPIADWYFPFDGRFHFFQTEFSVYDLAWPGNPPNL